ncbi:MAG: hypothetical protein EBR84_03615, partial [Actinobacteria bacterium]|nr:hypothetical protein [Actinomycetota bacterium]
GIWQPDFTNCDGHSILVLVPSSLPVGSAEILVTWDNQKSATSNVAVVAEPPSIDGLSEQSGKSGDVVTISGSYLTDIVSVTFDGDGTGGPVLADLSDANYVAATDGSSVTVTVPAGATTGTITVTTLSGLATSEDVYEVLTAPTIDSFSVPSGIAGDLVTIYGSNLASVLSVAFNGVETDLTDFNTVVADDGTSITVVLPDGFTSGKVTVATSGGTVTSELDFYLAGAPAITALSTLVGRVGSVLTITGTNLNGLQSVSFDGDGDSDPVLADLSNPLTRMTDTLVAVVVPAGATSGTITLTVSGGVVASDDVFEIAALPAVTSLSDTSLAPGQTLIIRGTDLTWAKVRIKGVLATVLGSSTDSVLKVTVPQVGPGKTTLVITT